MNRSVQSEGELKMNKEQNKGYALVLAAGALWGTIGFFSTMLSNLGMPSNSVAFFRVLSATIVLGVILLVKGKGSGLFRISKRGLFSCMLVGFVSQALYNMCYMSTIELSGMATAAVFLYTSPVYVAILSKLLFHEQLTSNKILAIALNIIGCVLAVTGGNFTDMKLSTRGLIMGILAGFCYALLPILSRLGADDENSYTAAFYGQAFAVLLLFVLIRPYNGIGCEFNWQMLLVLIGFGLVPSAMGYITYYGGLSLITETSKVQVLGSIETVVAALVGLVAFGQSVGLIKMGGIALVLISIAIMNMKRQERAVPDSNDIVGAEYSE